jgi:hypothetical protein
MKLEFSKFDIDSFDKSEDWKANCVFILEDGVFIEGLIKCRNGEISYYIVDVLNDDLAFGEFVPKFYMFKD